MRYNSQKGLCETCVRKEECTYIKMHSELVFFCEEFSTGCKPNDGFSLKSSEEINTESGYEGLCKNCENRRNCLICKKGVPVWHCEEYI